MEEPLGLEGLVSLLLSLIYSSTFSIILSNLFKVILNLRGSTLIRLCIIGSYKVATDFGILLINFAEGSHFSHSEVNGNIYIFSSL